MYADDILLIAPSMSVLQKLACEKKKLDAMDMIINVKKSSCLRVGPRLKVTCAEITTRDGNNLPWVSKIRYLVFLLFHLFRLNALQITHRASNAIFAKVGRIASEEVILFTNPYLWIGGVCFA